MQEKVAELILPQCFRCSRLQIEIAGLVNVMRVGHAWFANTGIFSCKECQPCGDFLVCFRSLLYFIHSLRSGLWPAPTVWEPELGVIGGSSGVHIVVEDWVAGTLRLAAFVGASSRLSMLLWS